MHMNFFGVAFMRFFYVHSRLLQPTIPDHKVRTASEETRKPADTQHSNLGGHVLVRFKVPDKTKWLSSFGEMLQ